MTPTSKISIYYVTLMFYIYLTTLSFSGIEVNISNVLMKNSHVYENSKKNVSLQKSIFKNRQKTFNFPGLNDVLDYLEKIRVKKNFVVLFVPAAQLFNPFIRRHLMDGI